MFKDIDTLLFDMDGTLIDSMWIWADIDKEYLGRFDIPFSEELQPSIEGLSFKETAVYFKEHFGIEDSIEKIQSDWNAMAYDKYCNEVMLKPNAREFLVKAKALGYKLAICTSNSKELVNAVLSRRGIKELFDTIIASGDVERGKPNPDIYLKAAKRLGSGPKNCIVFEDICPGIQAGVAAGMKTIAVEDDYSCQSREQKEKMADYYICDYAEIIERL